MADIKPTPFKVRTDKGALHSQHFNEEQAIAAAKVANGKAKELSIDVTYVVTDESPKLPTS